MEWDELKDRREKRRLGIFRAMHFNEVATEISRHPSTLEDISNNTRYLTVALRLTSIASSSAQQSYGTPSLQFPSGCAPLWQVKAGNVYPDQKL